MKRSLACCRSFLRYTLAPHNERDCRTNALGRAPVGCQPSCMAVTQPVLPPGCSCVAISSLLAEHCEMHLLHLVQQAITASAPVRACMHVQSLRHKSYLGEHAVQSRPQNGT